MTPLAPLKKRKGKKNENPKRKKNRGRGEGLRERKRGSEIRNGKKVTLLLCLHGCRICWEKFGWASQKADELLLPVLKEYNKHEVSSFTVDLMIYSGDVCSLIDQTLFPDTGIYMQAGLMS